MWYGTVLGRWTGSMQREELQTVAVSAGFAAALVAIFTGRLPRWLRIVLVACLVALGCGAGLFGYRHSTRPTTLTVAVGSVDGSASQLMSALAAQLASTGAPVRLKVVEKGTVLEASKAFSAGQVDLAIARDDVGDLSNALTVVVVTHGVVLLIAPPGTSMTNIDDLKGKTIGVVGGEVNRKVVEALANAYDPARVQLRFKDLTVADIPQALQSKQINALLVVMPVTEKYLTMLRNLFPRRAKQNLTLIPIESAGAIAAVTKYYQSYDLPKGTVQGSPPIPDEDMATLRVPFYLVANKRLSSDLVGSLAKAIMETRQDLISEFPLLAQISAPNTDKTDADNDTYIPIHPGANAYFSGDEKTFFDKYGDQIFYGTLLLGTLTSILAAVWEYMTRAENKPENSPLMRLYALTDYISKASKGAELTEVERRIDDILKGELEKHAKGEAEAEETAALGLATHRLEHLIAQRRATLDGAQANEIV
jgi:TRAP-type uncharacterized transport system substrate-binding protein